MTTIPKPVSKCCGAAVRDAVAKLNDGPWKRYICKACGKPCDTKEEYSVIETIFLLVVVVALDIWVFITFLNL